jgi:hypothetical protein
MSMDAATMMAQAADMTHRAAELLAAGRLEEAREIDRRATALRRRALNVAGHATADEPSALYSPAQSERDIVLDALTELDAIASPRLVADYVAARFQRIVAPRAFATLRRDERKAWQRPGPGRPTFVVPALESSFFAPQRAALALSSWPTWRRIVGPRTGRVELLRTARSVLRHLAWIAETDEASAARMERLLVTLVCTVPGALDGWSVRDRERTGEAIERELGALHEDDDAARQDAAKRAESQLDAEELLWGARPPHVVARPGGSAG